MKKETVFAITALGFLALVTVVVISQMTSHIPVKKFDYGVGTKGVVGSLEYDTSKSVEKPADSLPKPPGSPVRSQTPQPATDAEGTQSPSEERHELVRRDILNFDGGSDCVSPNGGSCSIDNEHVQPQLTSSKIEVTADVLVALFFDQRFFGKNPRDMEGRIFLIDSPFTTEEENNFKRDCSLTLPGQPCCPDSPDKPCMLIARQAATCALAHFTVTWRFQNTDRRAIHILLRGFTATGSQLIPLRNAPPEECPNFPKSGKLGTLIVTEARTQ